MSKARDVACDRCFQDRELVAWIRQGGKVGPCPWCGARKAYTVPLLELGPLFREVAQIYVRSDSNHGDTIGYLLQDDWDIFSDRIERDPDLRDDLATSILKAGLHPKDDVDEPDYSGLFEHSGPDLEDQWEGRLEGLLRKDTSVALRGDQAEPPEDPLHFDPLEVALEDLTTDYAPGSVLFRARIHTERGRTEWFEPKDLSAPPPEKATVGRGNPAGQPVLYVASHAETALAEVRAWTGAAVAIGKVQTNRPLTLVDLVHSRRPTSPFFQELLAWKLDVAGLLYKFAEALSRPILPGEEESLYLPSQHLCAFIRESGYDGLIYPSAMGSGHNVLLFDPSAADVVNVEYVRVTGVQHAFEMLGEGDAPYEELPYNSPPPGEPAS